MTFCEIMMAILVVVSALNAFCWLKLWRATRSRR